MAALHLTVHEGLSLHLQRLGTHAGTAQLHAAGKTLAYAAFQHSDVRADCGPVPCLWIGPVAFDMSREQLAKAEAFLNIGATAVRP